MIIERDFIYVNLTSEQADKINAVWNNKRNIWKLPNTLGVLRELHGLGFDVKDYGIQKRIQRDKLISLKRLDDAPGDERLRPYQRVTLNYAQRIPHVGLFLEQRLGKTPVALRIFEEEGRKKNLIVCPASLVHNWSREVKTWTDKTPYVVKGTKKQRMKIYEDFNIAEEGYLILSKDVLRMDVETIETM